MMLHQICSPTFGNRMWVGPLHLHIQHMLKAATAMPLAVSGSNKAGHSSESERVLKAYAWLLVCCTLFVFRAALLVI